MAKTAVRGTFLDFVDDPYKHVGNEEAAARFQADGLLVIEDGVIVDFGAYDDIASKHEGVEITEIRDRIILPGFIDGHIHLPQTRVLGAYGEQLLPWLQKWVFPEEHRYAERSYAEEGTKHFFDNLLASGTTTAQTFTTGSLTCNEVFFEEAARRNMRMIGGLTGIDTHVPDYFATTPEQFYADSSALIEKWHGTGRALYAITPRFAFGASTELMEACRRLKEEHPDLWVNTHISENPAEIRGVLALHDDCTDYLGVYEKYGLVGPKFTGGHGVWLSNDEFRRFSDSGAAVAFCPSSNLYLGSGLFRLGRALDPERRVRIAYGTDMGGGNRFSMLNSLEDGYKVGMLNNTILDGSIVPSEQDLAESERNKLSPLRAFYSLTKGGAEALYIDDFVGSFDIGKEADFVALDWTAGPPATAWHQSLSYDGGAMTLETASDLLFGVMMVGDERAVDQTWVAGELAYQKA
ncbi:guanine deaminase [Herbiconiux sp. VKM Ac-1786]|uniref:guanine deaminase n=1 Tax=Herbiconiux sp. VKM Ac-1786 TaxID=2783824 RepID=UPI001889E7F7|nr:guanine deaminase [Herbiconiux sp. VKM Ac-1786]MBF4574139.1 guanine deaminase [Herbiconiux sp. VKM Ac-1786]